MINLRATRTRAGAAAALAAVTVFVAACGGSASSTPSTPAASAGTATAAGVGASASTAAIGSASGSAGTYLTGAGGRALYLWDADSAGESKCSGACARAWPPLVVKAKPTATGGVKAGELGTVARAGGTKQVTYNGHPLYYFAGDSHKGTTSGQGSDDFGAKWWLVNTAGSAIASGASGGSAAGSSTSTSNGY